MLPTGDRLRRFAECRTRLRQQPLRRRSEERRVGKDAAQSLCDKLVNDQEFFSSLNTDELCRLALLFVRLAENYGDENANTAFASKTLDAAIERNADSTALFLARAPMEDRARLSLISAISESRRNPVSVDSLEYDPSDSIIIY